MLLIFDYLVGSLAILFTIIAYYQKDMTRFLQINILAASFFSASLYINGAITGALIVLLSVSVYIIALLTSPATKKTLTKVIPPIAFIISYYAYDTPVISHYALGYLIPYIPAFASLIITVSILQTSIINNKILLSLGLILWIIYTFIYQAWFAFTADALGLVSVLASLYMIKRSKTTTNPSS